MATTPFAMSIKATSTPYFQPRDKVAFEAPAFPWPTSFKFTPDNNLAAFDP